MNALHILPTRAGAAAENMAVDFLLLQRYPEPAVPRFRHYEWHRPAFTFGFGQKIGFVREILAGELPCDLCRRPTGGGIVDHRNDWTYALVLPRGHALYDERATHAYQIVHECLAAALVALGQPAGLQTVGELEDSTGSEPARESGGLSRAGSLPRPGMGVCFQQAELHDVVDLRTGAKIAGAAQKRNKHGLLFQGSIERSRVAVADWDDFLGRFSGLLAAALGAEPAETPWPDLNEEEVAGLIEQYSAPEWIEYR